MSKKMNRALIVLAAALFGNAGLTQAAPLLSFAIQGSNDGGNTWSTSVSAHAGDTIQYRVFGSLAAIGTSNTTASTSLRTLATGDGIQSLSFNLGSNSTTDATDAFQTANLATGWDGGTGHSAGTIAGDQLTAARPIQTTGVFVGGSGSSVVVLSGTFKVGSISEAISATWGSAVGSAKAGTSAATTAFSINATNAFGGADPVASFTPLSIAVPEPASMALLGLAVPALLRRRRIAK